MYECAGWSWVRESVRYITHNSCAISVVPSFNKKQSNFINYLSIKKKKKAMSWAQIIFKTKLLFTAMT